MADRVTAAVRDIAKTVHSNPDASKAAIRQNMKRTNDALTKLGSRLHFFIRSGVMHREIAG